MALFGIVICRYVTVPILSIVFMFFKKNQKTFKASFAVK